MTVSAEPLKAIAAEYLNDVHILKPGDRLHRLVARLGDTYYDDLTEDRIVEIERLVDQFRLTHADGSRLTVA